MMMVSSAAVGTSVDNLPASTGDGTPDAVPAVPPASTSAAAPAAPAAEAVSFASLGLPDPLLRAVKAVGYESASPIQAATIPLLLQGHDVLGQAQTGTGKTAAFALPILARLELKKRVPQALVLVPTRELAIQVAEAFQKYATGQAAFQVLPIYGGQSYTPQLNALARGPQVIVGTPGRIIDHLERGSLSLDGLRCVVLDEADEMLAMGFADALEAILSQTPAEKQVALFSATMAPNIRRIAQRHLTDPQEVVIKGRTATAANIRQRYWIVSGMHKLDALTRIVEVADFDAMLVFVRTKQATVELAERLQARGFAATALNGDIQQAMRERTIARLKDGKIDILVATDVAARGLDVERITHVVNYDVPYDTESYVHRIGRTGRAGRSGEAILFIAPRERHLLKLIERATRQKIEPLTLPTVDDVNSRRLAKFKARIGEAIAASPNEFYRKAVQEVSLETGLDLLTVASAVASLVEGPAPAQKVEAGLHESSASSAYAAGPAAAQRPAAAARPKRVRDRAADRPGESLDFDDDGMETTWRLAVGKRHGVLAGDIVGALAHEGRLDGSQINGVTIRADYSLVRLPARLPQAVIARLAEVRVRGQALDLQVGESGAARSAAAAQYEAAPAPVRPARGKRSIADVLAEVGMADSMPAVTEAEFEQALMDGDAAADAAADVAAVAVAVAADAVAVDTAGADAADVDSDAVDVADSPAADSPAMDSPAMDSEAAPSVQSTTFEGDAVQAPAADKVWTRAAGKDKGAGKGAGDFADKPARKPAGKYAGAAPRPYGDKAAARPWGEKAPRPYGDKATRPYGDKAPRPYGDRSEGQSADRSGGRYADKAGGNYGDKVAGKYGERSTGRYGDKSASKFGDKAPSKYGDKAPSKYGDRPAGKFASKTSGERYPSKTPGKPPQRAAGGFAGKPRPAPSGRPPRPSTNKPTRPVTAKKTTHRKGPKRTA